MAVYKRGDVWWHSFIFDGQRIQESSKSPSKTVAKKAEEQRRCELERALNGLESARETRIRTIKDIAAEYLDKYRVRFRSVKFAEYAVGHVVRLLGDRSVLTVGRSKTAAGEG